jgi:poly-gamma-glutamate capsule biosynthesis protein CapA/YwtB (metallophosphatase superfamily)
MRSVHLAHRNMTYLAFAAVALPSSWTMALGGDLMLNQIDPKIKPMAAVAPFFKEADVAIANLEIPLTSAKTATTRKSLADRKAKKQFVLKADPKFGAQIAEIGIDAVSLGNNHAMDYGPKGLAEMLGILDRLGIAHAGAGASERLAKAAAPVRVGESQVALRSFLSFMSDSANNTCWPAVGDRPGLASLKFQGSVDDDARKSIAWLIKDARRTAPFVAIALHWGIEKQAVPTPYQIALGRAFIDAGADVVIGHHPHVLQGAELYNGKPIFYSLGNFVSPRPAQTGFMRLTWQRHALKAVEFMPASISGGKVRPQTGAKAQAEWKRFIKLGETLRKRYPSKRSKALSVSLAKP